MSDKILLKILAISVVLVTIISCMTPCIVVGDLNEHSLKRLSVSEEESSKSNYTFSLHGNVKLLWSYVNEERDAEILFDPINDANGDGINDVLIFDYDSTNKLLLISGKNGSILWSKSMPVMIRLDSLSDDANGDGIDDIIINKETNENSLIVELVSGLDGSEIWRKNVDGYDRAHGIYRDLNGDGIEDILLEDHEYHYPNYRCEICTLSANDGSKLWNKTFEGNVHSSCYCFRDVTGDSIYDFIIRIYNKSTNIGELFAIRGSDGYVEWHKSFTGDPGWVFPEYDFDGDGLVDLNLEIHDFNNKTTKVLVLKGSDGSIIWSKLYNFYAKEYGLDDLNANGTTDLCLELGNFTTRCVIEVQVLSGRDGSLIWNKNVNVFDVGKCSDLNKDGKDDILLVNSTEIAENKYLYDVIAICGINGSEIWEKLFTHDISTEIPEGAYKRIHAWVDGTSDLNGDDIEDISLEIEFHYYTPSGDYIEKSVFVINGKNGSELWNVKYAFDEPRRHYYSLHTGDDFNSDGINDVLLRTKKGVYLLVTTEAPINKPPIALYTYIPPNPSINQLITFDASESSDSDGNIINYKWNFGDGKITSTSEKTLTHPYSSAGDYTGILTVTDNEGATDSISKIVRVSPEKVLDVTFFSQRDPAWRDKKLDHSPYSLGEYGCALTSAAMVAKYFGYDTDPDKLNTSLTAVGGLDTSGIIYWKKVEEVSDGKVAWIESVGASWSRINQELSSENPVISSVNCPLGTHFIVFVGKSGDEHYFLDPYDKKSTIHEWPNGAHGEYTLKNLKIYHGSTTTLVGEGSFWVEVSNPAGAYICNDSVDFTFTRNLKRGDRGDDVKYLQIVLNANPAAQVAVEGPGSPCHETNYFGQLTEAAVIKFQTLHDGLTQTGEIDEATRAELNKLYLPVKHVPTGWVLNVTNTAQNEEIHDGCLWWEVEDVTDGIKGWVAYQNDATKYLVIGDQDELNDKIKKLDTKDDRIPVLLHAVTEHRTEFLPDNFPPGIILAMAIQESGGAGFDNEIVALTPWGRGIMQIDMPDHYVGAGSGIRWYNNGAVDYCRGKEGHGCTCSAGVCCCEACKHYYSNTIQGIEANIKDGLYVLSDKYNCQCCYDRGKDAEWDAEEGLYREEMGDEVILYSRDEECKGGDGQSYDSRIEKIKIGSVQISCNEFKVIDAVWRYNGRSIYPEGSCMGNDYLRCVAGRLNEIGSTFGYEMHDKDTWIECLKAVSHSASVMKRIK